MWKKHLVIVVRNMCLKWFRSRIMRNQCSISVVIDQIYENQHRSTTKHIKTTNYYINCTKEKKSVKLKKTFNFIASPRSTLCVYAIGIVSVNKVRFETDWNSQSWVLCATRWCIKIPGTAQSCTKWNKYRSSTINSITANPITLISQNLVFCNQILPTDTMLNTHG